MMPKPSFKKLLPVAILAVVVVLVFLIVSNPPSPPRSVPDDTPQISVETRIVKPRDYQIELTSYGNVRPRIQSMLVSQVSGMIMDVSPNFRDGGFFKEGEILLRIDDRDYRADVQIAEAQLLDAQQKLAEEQARSEQALVDWKRLGNEGEASDLVLRKPQLLAALAALESAQANLTKARLNIERAQVKAPFSGRILSKQVDVGQVVSTNANLAEIYATQYVEVRLPLCSCDLEFIDLPESAAGADTNPISVTMNSSLSNNRQWQGQVVRTESSIDDTARQLHVIAQIDDPFTIDADNPASIKIGEYVTARLRGKLMENAIVVPVATIYQGSYVYTVENGTLMRKTVDIAWQNADEAIIQSGLDSGDELVLTPLGQVTSGTRVTVNKRDGMDVQQVAGPPLSATSGPTAPDGLPATPGTGDNHPDARGGTPL